MALLLVTLALAALLAVEAEDEVGAHRETAARAVREWVGVTGREALEPLGVALATTLRTALGPVVEGRAASPYEPLPMPGVLAASADDAFPCAAAEGAARVARRYVRLDLRDGSLALDAPATPALTRWLRDTLAAAVRAGAGAGSPEPYGVVLARGGLTGRAVVFGVKRAPFDAPLAVYGMVTCADAFGEPLVALAEGGRGGGALRTALADSLVTIEVRDGSGGLVARAAAAGGADGVREPGAPVATLRVAGLTLDAVPGPGAARRLVLLRDRNAYRLPVLGALLAATAALVFLALRQLGREQELVRLRADFTSSVSHELRTPLAQILLFGETLALGRTRDEAERRAAADAIVREARRLMHMVENVLHAARAERRINAVEPRDVALAPLVRDVVEGFAPLAAAAGAHVAVAVDPELVVRAEPEAVRQILLNLLDNAARYGPSGQLVSVGAAAADGGVRLFVDDGGPGVPARDRERVWAPFVRLGRDRAGAALGGARTGSGLGLAVVADLVRLHGGRAWIEDAPRGGARVIVELPRVDAALMDAAVPNDAPPNASPGAAA